MQNLSLSIHVVSYIKIAAYPKNIMYIERVQYCDIPPSDIVTFLNNPNDVIARVNAPRVAVEEVSAIEETEEAAAPEGAAKEQALGSPES